MATLTDKKGDAKASARDAAAPGGTRKKMLLMLIVGVVVALAAAAGAYLLFIKEPGPPPEPQPGAMVQMDPMTLSLADKHFLKVQIAIQLVDGAEVSPESGFETVKASQLLIDTFSNLPMEDIATNAARKNLTAQLLKGLQQAYPEEVYDVYLTQFVIQ